MPVGRHKLTEREEKTEVVQEVEAVVPEDDQPIPAPTVEQMSKKANWVHYAKNILRNNKTSHAIVDEVEDRDKEIDRLLAADPYEPRLKSITEDKCCKGNYPAWILRCYGDQMKYAMANPLHGAKQYGVVVVKSTVWPGQMSYFWQGQWGELYMGDGQKHEDVTYYPVQPPTIMNDPEERPICQEVSSRAFD